MSRFNAFADIECVMLLEDKYLPKIKYFTDRIDDMIESNIQNKECIQRFDESMSFKANKSAIMTIEHDLGKDFIKKEDWPLIDSKIDSVKYQMESQKDGFQREIREFKENVGVLTKDVMYDLINNKFH